MIRGRIPKQKALKFRLFCHLFGLNIQDALEEAIDDLLAKNKFAPGAPVPPCSSINDLDEDDDEKEENVSLSSSSAKAKSATGALPLQLPRPTEEDGKTERILTVYSAVTGNPIRESDRAAYTEIAKYSELAIEAGIRRSVIHCPTRVNSLKYCIGAIVELSEAETIAGSDYLSHLISSCERKGEIFRRERYEERQRIIRRPTAKSEPEFPRRPIKVAS
jgi:hypothetical protein